MRLFLPLVLVSSLISPPVLALEMDRLWLPVKYRGHYIKLRDAALAAEATEKCEEVLRATIDRDLSTPEHPYYRILCRQPNHVTYSEIVDGLTMQPRSQTVDEPPPETPKEREQRLAEEAAAEERARALAAEKARQKAEQERLAAEKAKAEAEQLARKKLREEQRRKELFEGICQSEILAKTSMMMNLTWVTERPIAEALSNGQMRYYAEFDAQNLWGQRLEYKAVCTISTPSELVVVVSQR